MPRCEDNIKIDHKAAGCGGAGWINQDQDRVQWWVALKLIRNLHILSEAGNFLTS